MRLKEIRKKNGLSAEALAKEIGVTQAAVANWENDRRKMNVDTLIRIAEVLRCTPNDLLGFPQEREESGQGVRA